MVPRREASFIKDLELGAEVTASVIEAEMDAQSYMFAPYKDGDPYEWLRKLGAYSPIVHLQQTNGTSSGHQPFTKECNEKGIIKGEKVISALYKVVISLV